MELFQLPKFPINFIDLEELIPKNIINNINLKKCRVEFKKLLNEMKLKWIESSFKLTKEQLLNDHFINNLNNILSNIIKK
jgi:hypothetical protein